MTLRKVNIGSYPDDTNADRQWAAFEKINANFDEVDNRLESGAEQTGAIRSDLSSTSDPEKGAGMVGAVLEGTVQEALSRRVYRIATVTDAVPAAISEVYVEARRSTYAYVSIEPSHEMKFSSGGRWFEIADPVLSTDMIEFSADADDDDRVLLNAILSVGRPVQIKKPKRKDRYRVTGALNNLNGQEIFSDDYAEIYIDSAVTATILDFSGKQRASARGLRLRASVACPQLVVVNLHNAFRCEVSNLDGANLPGDPLYGSVRLSGSAFFNEVSHLYLDGCAASAIYVGGSSCSLNTITQNELQNNGKFGVFVDAGANRNEISFNKTTNSALELIGVRYNCHANRIGFNHAENCGDNGISVTGSYNTIVGNVCLRNYNAGIGIFGTGNTCTGNECYDNGQNTLYEYPGIWIVPGFGGVAQYNTVANNNTGNRPGNTTQKHGVRKGDNVHYPTWSAATAVAAFSYSIQGLNIYQTTAGGTTGPTAPTHTTGTVSDGSVDWTYVSSFVINARSTFNTIGPNTSYAEQNPATADISWDGDHLLMRDNFRMPGSAVVGGGTVAPYTTLRDITVGNGAGDRGIAIWHAATGRGRLSFGNTSTGAYVEYDGSTGLLALQRAGGAAFSLGANSVASNRPVKVATLTVAQLTGVFSAASQGAGAVTYITDEASGAVLAFSDGANWRRVTDRAVVT